MDSDDDIHHDSEVDSWIDSGKVNDDVVHEFDNLSCQSPKNYMVLKEEDIKKRQHDDIERVSSVLFVSKESALILLYFYNWNVNRVEEEWFRDEDRVRKAVGLMEEKPHVTQIQEKRKVVTCGMFFKPYPKVVCGICFESYRVMSIDSEEQGVWTWRLHKLKSVRQSRRSRNDPNILPTKCGHHFCTNCWTTYISTAINDGAGCLTLKCPAPSCRAAVGLDRVNMLSSDNDKDKYNRYLLRSCVEDKKNTKWCPSPGCDCAVEYDQDHDDGRFVVTCLCSYSFCWNCTEEAHRPLDCKTMAKWVKKKNDQSENTKWLLDNSKTCPKCNRPIEKDQGCNHMTCTAPCNHEFCWLCGADWSDHYCQYNWLDDQYKEARNRYKNKEDEVEDEERERLKLEMDMVRYTPHYQHWAAKELCRKRVLEDLQEMQSVKFEEIRTKLGQPEAKLEFITDGWLQVVECMRVLKWTCAYGYYLPEEEHGKRELFEYMLEEAEASLDTLYYCAEDELDEYLYNKNNNNNKEELDPIKDFNSFRKRLTRLTHVTRNYFENLVRAFENGLVEVRSIDLKV